MADYARERDKVPFARTKPDSVASAAESKCRSCGLVD